MEKVSCDVCGSKHTTKQGHKVFAGVGRVQRYQCQDCGHWIKVSGTHIIKHSVQVVYV